MKSSKLGVSAQEKIDFKIMLPSIPAIQLDCSAGIGNGWLNNT